MRGLPAPYIFPKLDGWLMSVEGPPKLTVFSTLKNSPFTVKLKRSVIGIFFSSAASHSLVPKVRMLGGMAAHRQS